MTEPNQRRHMDLRRRSIYLLPNLFTTAALFAGFYAIVQAMNGKFEYAAVAIFIAMVLDGLDGRVARLTHTQSEFGAEYDSLSDMVSFGVAPSILMYEWAFRDLGKWGWFAAFIYCAGRRCVWRASTPISTWSTSVTSRACPVRPRQHWWRGFVWVMLDNRFTGFELRWYAAALTVFAGLSMVSSLKYYSFKSINMRKSVPFIVIFLFALFFILVSVDPPLAPVPAVLRLLPVRLRDVAAQPAQAENAAFFAAALALHSHSTRLSERSQRGAG